MRVAIANDDGEWFFCEMHESQIELELERDVMREFHGTYDDGVRSFTANSDAAEARLFDLYAVPLEATR